MSVEYEQDRRGFDDGGDEQERGGFETAEAETDAGSEAAVAAASAETGLIHLPVTHDEEEAEPAVEPSYAPDAEALTAREEELGRLPGADFDERMRAIQVAFIDDPRRAALDSDDLLAEVLQAFADDMARRRRELEAETGAGAEPDTEKLRLAVRRSRELVALLAADGAGF